MIIQGKQALADYLKISYSSIDTNFPKMAKKQLEKGIKITRQGKGDNTVYILENVEPQIVDKSNFSTKEKVQILENEIWKVIPDYPEHQISNFGRIKNKYNYLIKGSPCRNGYIQVELKTGEKRMVHRLVLSTFNPIENQEKLTVDHLNGIRNDNRLENLQWSSREDNISFVLTRREDINKEISRIIQKYGYEETLAKLKAL